MKPIGTGFDVLAPIYGADGFSLVGEPLPNYIQTLNERTGASRLKKTAKDAEADYIVIEGCPIRTLLELVMDPEFEGRILAPVRGDCGIIEEFRILQPELATKPFPPE